MVFSDQNDNPPDGENNEQSACWRTIGVWGQQTPCCERLKEVIHCHNCDVFASQAERVFANLTPDEMTVPFDISEASQEPGRLNLGDVSVLCFRLASYWFCLPTSCVLFVADRPPIHSLPKQACPFIQGIVAVQGELQVCFSLAQLFGLSVSESSLVNKMPGTYRRLLSVNLPPHKIAFYVDEVRGVYRYFSKDITAISADVILEDQSFFLGSIHHLLEDQNQACLLIDDAKLAIELGRYLQ